MTRNILIATIFTLLTTFLLGGIFIYEGQRLPAATAAVTAEQIERGARDYEQYCGMACHGIAGQGGVAFGAPSLNDIVQRYQEDGRFEAPNGIRKSMARCATILRQRYSLASVARRCRPSAHKAPCVKIKSGI